MKKRLFTALLAVVLCAALLVSCLPLTAFAESADDAVQMVEGEVKAGFVPAGTACTSSDPSVAWVDENGSLNALKEGSVTISDGTNEYTVTVSDYVDGSDVVGSLKLLARYNDSMQFYDGHVYLLFTSYQDGVEMTVPDLYAAYEIKDQYYADVRADISKGSNHTGKDAYEYFEESTDINTVTLNRGEIVTIGMYRSFDLSVIQAALGSVTHSSLWKDLTAAGKSAIIKALFDYLDKGVISSEEALAQIKAVINKEGLDYNNVLDGVVDGGVCFNRELYNQKLEWDQYENVTYELDITRNQLDTMMMYLGGNNGKFSILKNSCATVALRAWNAAVGTRNGEPTAYYLTAEADGIFAYIDAPKGVRDNIVKRLPGYYLNNAAGVAEPDAGYQDETGWVYVSAPEKVNPLTILYDDDSIVIDEEAVHTSKLISAAKGDQSISYSKGAQEIGVSVRHEAQGEFTTIEGVDFDINGVKLALNGENLPEDGVQFKMAYPEPVENEYYYLVNQDGEEISGYYNDGYLFIYTDMLPITYRVMSAAYEEEPTGFNIFVGGAGDIDIVPQVYYKNGKEKIAIEDEAILDPGTKIYIKAAIPEDDDKHILNEIRFDDESVMNSDHFDAKENAYFVIVPDAFTDLSLYYEEAAISLRGADVVQLKVGDTINIKDYVKLTSPYFEEEFENIAWEAVYDPFDGAVSIDGGTLTGKKQGNVIVKAYAAENSNIAVALNVEVYDSFDDMCAVTMDSNGNKDYQLCYTIDDIDTVFTVPFSGYRVQKGAVMTVVPMQEDSKALRSVKVNGTAVKAGETFTVDQDAEVKVDFASAKITNLPKSVKIETKDASYQLKAQVKYTGLMQFLPVYDSTVAYRSSDPLIAVDDNGLITVAGDIPDGGMIVYVTAYAGSSNEKVSAACKVIVGDCQGERIVGSLTISARPIVKAQLVSHAMITFTPYEDTELDVSYYEYYKPNEKFHELMRDYADHPENYSSDPVLYNDNELGIDDRSSYFDTIYAGAYSEPQPIKLTVGESITMSNYGDERANFVTILKVLENSTLAAVSPQTQELIQYMHQYLDGEEFDASAAFDDLLATLGQIYGYTKMTGYNPADGTSQGGLMINREAYNQFRRSDSQMPNHYYTVDITADELARFKAYLSDPQNNTYSLFNKNCATGSVEIWNTTLSDRPELAIKGNFTGVAADPMSVYFALGSLQSKSDLDGKAGNNFYPRILVLNPSEKPAPIDPLTEYRLGDADADGEITILDATTIQRYLAGLIGEEDIDLTAGDVTRDGIDITDATFIQRCLASMETPYPIGDVFGRSTEKATD